MLFRSQNDDVALFYLLSLNPTISELELIAEELRRQFRSSSESFATMMSWPGAEEKRDFLASGEPDVGRLERQLGVVDRARGVVTHHSWGEDGWRSFEHPFYG